MDIDPILIAWSRLRRRRFDQVIDICTQILEQTPLDQQAWYLKTRALIEKAYVDDNEMEDDSVAEALMDHNAMADAPRPGTSMTQPLNSSHGGSNQGIRPVSNIGRPLTGFSRPGNQSAGRAEGANEALGSFRPMTSRPITSAGGRFVRPLTSSFVSEKGGPFINLARLNLNKYASVPPLAKVPRFSSIFTPCQILCDYILYVEQDAKKALELGALATEQAKFRDWWWKSRLGKCYYRLGLYRDAEQQWRSSLADQNMITTHLSLAKIFLKLDQPNAALEVYLKGHEQHPGEISLLLGVARVYDSISDVSHSMQLYRRVLHFDNANIEAIACIAANHFYADQPEVALRYYRRLLQMGVNTCELWNNVGLCCFYAQQYDLTLTCLKRALDLGTDADVADVWYNISHIALGIGDLNLAYQSLRIATNLDPHHGEAMNNLGVLELRRNRPSDAMSCFQSSIELNRHIHEPLYNSALMAERRGDFKTALKLISNALKNYSGHVESRELSVRVNEFIVSQ